MAEKLDVNTGGHAVGKKLWDMHQKDEYKSVNNYKEGYCWMCEEKKAVGATVVDVCQHCSRNRGMESILVSIANKGYALCHFCAKYQWDVYNINVRLCTSCYDRVRRTFKKFRHGGGDEELDPFWKYLKRRNGQDWKILMSDGATKYFRK